MSSIESLIFSARLCTNGILTLGGVDKTRTEIDHIERGSGIWPLTTETHLKTPIDSTNRAFPLGLYHLNYQWPVNIPIDPLLGGLLLAEDCP